VLSGVSASGVTGANRDEGCYVDPRRRLQVRLNPVRFADRDALRRYLRHEVQHAADILDPSFAYREESLDEPTRRRYAALWCASIEERLAGAALEPATHPGLLQRARAMARPKCPLCSLPTADWASPRPETNAWLRHAFPEWSPDQGLCGRCLEWAEVSAGQF
jgi:hypothetical protein